MILNKIGKPVYVFRFYPPKQEFNLTYLLHGAESFVRS